MKQQNINHHQKKNRHLVRFETSQDRLVDNHLNTNYI